MKHLIYLLILCTLLFSCSDTEQEKLALPENTQFGFRLVDSLMIDFMGELRIIDFEPQSNLFLAMESTRGDILEIDRRGNIVMQRNMKEGPEGYGNFADKMGFWGPDKRVVQAANQVIIYSKDWTVLKKIPFKGRPAFFVMNMVKEPAKILASNGRSLLILNDQSIQDVNKVDLHAELPYNRFHFLDLNTEEEFGAIPFPADHPYRNYPNLIKGEVNPNWMIAKDKLIIKMPYADFIEIYDMHNLEWIENIPVETELAKIQFGLPKVRLQQFDKIFDVLKERWKRGNFNSTQLKFEINGQIINLFHLTSAAPAELIDPLTSSDMQAFSAISAQLNYAYQPLINGNKRGKEFPVNFKGFPLLSFDKNKMLVQLRDSEMEYEPDLLTFYIYQFGEMK